jgi:hypothetical protein
MSFEKKRGKADEGKKAMAKSAKQANGEMG